jgi:hypothetical protein
VYRIDQPNGFGGEGIAYLFIDGCHDKDSNNLNDAIK